MKLPYVRITILDCFFTDTLNWQVLWRKENYLLNCMYEKLEKKVSLKEM